MKRKRSVIQDSLDLFLDAICNTFGGIVLISIVAAILLQAVGRQQETPVGTTTAGVVEQLRLTLQQHDAEEAAKTRAVQVLEDVVRDRFDDEVTQQLIERTRAAAAARDQRIGDKQDAIDDVTARTIALELQHQTLQEIEARVLEEQEQLLAAQRRLSAEREARTKTAPLPKAKIPPPFLNEIAVIVSRGRYYEVHNNTARGRRTGLNAQEFVIVSEDDAGIRVIPKPYAGTKIADSVASRSILRQRMARFRNDSVNVCFVVRTDSFEEFDVVRSVAVELKLHYRVMPTDGGIVDQGGSGGKVQ